eukprot:3254324-Rhodomonas_salina.1
MPAPTRCPLPATAPLRMSSTCCSAPMRCPVAPTGHVLYGRCRAAPYGTGIWSYGPDVWSYGTDGGRCWYQVKRVQVVTVGSEEASEEA